MPIVTPLNRRQVVTALCAAALVPTIALNAQTKPPVPVPAAVPLLGWAEFSVIAAGLPADTAHVWLKLPEFAAGPLLEVTLASSLSGTSRMALFSTPTPRTSAAATAKATTWATVAVFDLQLTQVPEVTLPVPFTANTSYLLAVVAAGKMYQVIRSVKLVSRR